MVALGLFFRDYFSAADIVSYAPGPKKLPANEAICDGSIVLCVKVWHALPR